MTAINVAHEDAVPLRDGVADSGYRPWRGKVSVDRALGVIAAWFRVRESSGADLAFGLDDVYAAPGDRLAIRARTGAVAVGAVVSVLAALAEGDREPIAAALAAMSLDELREEVEAALARELPRLREDVMAEAEAGAGVAEIAAPDGAVLALYDVELAIACAMDGTRGVRALVEWAKADLGLRTTTAEVRDVIAALAAAGCLEAPARAANVRPPEIVEEETPLVDEFADEMPTRAGVSLSEIMMAAPEPIMLDDSTGTDSGGVGGEAEDSEVDDDDGEIAVEVDAGDGDGDADAAPITASEPDDFDDEESGSREFVDESPTVSTPPELLAAASRMTPRGYQSAASQLLRARRAVDDVDPGASSSGVRPASGPAPAPTPTPAPAPPRPSGARPDSGAFELGPPGAPAPVVPTTLPGSRSPLADSGPGSWAARASGPARPAGPARSVAAPVRPTASPASTTAPGSGSSPLPSAPVAGASGPPTTAPGYERSQLAGMPAPGSTPPPLASKAVVAGSAPTPSGAVSVPRSPVAAPPRAQSAAPEAAPASDSGPTSTGRGPGSGGIALPLPAPVAPRLDLQPEGGLRCSRCGTDNQSGMKYCRNCGMSLAVLAAPRTSAMPAVLMRPAAPTTPPPDKPATIRPPTADFDDEPATVAVMPQVAAYAPVPVVPTTTPSAVYPVASLPVVSRTTSSTRTMIPESLDSPTIRPDQGFNVFGFSDESPTLPPHLLDAPSAPSSPSSSPEPSDDSPTIRPQNATPDAGMTLFPRATLRPPMSRTPTPAQIKPTGAPLATAPLPPSPADPSDLRSSPTIGMGSAPPRASQAHPIAAPAAAAPRPEVALAPTQVTASPLTAADLPPPTGSPAIIRPAALASAAPPPARHQPSQPPRPATSQPTARPRPATAQPPVGQPAPAAPAWGARPPTAQPTGPQPLGSLYSTPAQPLVEPLVAPLAAAPQPQAYGGPDDLGSTMPAGPPAMDFATTITTTTPDLPGGRPAMDFAATIRTSNPVFGATRPTASAADPLPLPTPPPSPAFVEPTTARGMVPMIGPGAPTLVPGATAPMSPAEIQAAQVSRGFSPPMLSPPALPVVHFASQPGARKCPTCGNLAVPQSRFCGICGTSIPDDAPPQPVPYAARDLLPSASRSMPLPAPTEAPPMRAAMALPSAPPSIAAPDSSAFDAASQSYTPVPSPAPPPASSVAEPRRKKSKLWLVLLLLFVVLGAGGATAAYLLTQ